MKKQSGSGLIFAVILLFVILGMVVTLSSITVLETKMSQKTKSSVGAFYNSESGVEWALNKIANAAGDNISDAFPGFAGGQYDCPSGFECDVYFLDDQGDVIASDDTIDKIKAVRSIGSQTAGGEATQRAIEAAVAAGDYSYTYYCYDDHPTYGAMGTPLCNDAGGSQGYCPSGYTQKLALGSWGFCGNSGWAHFFLPPGGTCAPAWSSYSFITGRAYVCSQ